MSKQETCEQRVGAALESEIFNLKLLWLGYTMGERKFGELQELGDKKAELLKNKPTDADEQADWQQELDNVESDIEVLDEDEQFVAQNADQLCDLGGPEGIYDYGLSFDYVTGEDGESDYYRWQLSWGGPSDEFRFYANPNNKLWCVEYWFKDWFDGASITLRGEQREVLNNYWEWFVEAGTVDHMREEALQHAND